MRGPTERLPTLHVPHDDKVPIKCTAKHKKHRFDILLAAALTAPFSLRPHDLVPAPPNEAVCRHSYRYAAFPSPWSGGAQNNQTIPSSVLLRVR